MQDRALMPETSTAGSVVFTALGPSASANAVALQADGRIVAFAAIGTRSASGGSTEAALVRYLPDGRLDTSFGDGGIAWPSTPMGEQGFGANGYYPRSLVVQPDGKIVAAASWGENQSGVALARFNADGTQDTGFHSPGLDMALATFGVPYRGGWDVALQPDGKVLVVGFLYRDEQEVAVTRFNADGTLDTGFNGTGTATFDFGAGSWDQGVSLAVLGDGKILVAGTSGAVPPASGSSAFAAARLTSDGHLDSTFHSTGTVVTPVEATGFDPTNSVARTSLVVASDGSFAIAGRVGDGATLGIEVARYHADGTPDLAFNGTGVATFGTAGLMQLIVGDAVLQADGKIVVAATGWSLAGGHVGFLRFDTDGHLDAGFGEAGLKDFAVDWAGVNALAIDSQGRFVAAGFDAEWFPDVTGPHRIAITRLLADGDLDPTFGSPTAASLAGVVDAPATADSGPFPG